MLAAFVMLDVAGCGELCDRDGAGDNDDELIGVVLVAMHGGMLPAHLRCGRFECARWWISSYVAVAASSRRG